MQLNLSQEVARAFKRLQKQPNLFPLNFPGSQAREPNSTPQPPRSRRTHGAGSFPDAALPAEFLPQPPLAGPAPAEPLLPDPAPRPGPQPHLAKQPSQWPPRSLTVSTAV